MKVRLDALLWGVRTNPSFIKNSSLSSLVLATVDSLFEVKQRAKVAEILFQSVLDATGSFGSEVWRIWWNGTIRNPVCYESLMSHHRRFLSWTHCERIHWSWWYFSWISGTINIISPSLLYLHLSTVSRWFMCVTWSYTKASNRNRKTIEKPTSSYPIIDPLPLITVRIGV